MHIDVPRYLEVALQVSDADRRFIDHADALLPESIVDAHTHTGLAEHVISLPADIEAHVMSTFPYYSLDDAERLRSHLWRDRRVQSLRMPHPYAGIDHRGANDYLARACAAGSDQVAICGLPDDVDYTVLMVGKSHAAALKMYHRYFQPAAKHIYDFFPPAVLEEASSKAVPILLHLPVALDACLPEVLQLLRDFPHLVVVFAHVAMVAAATEQAAEALKTLSQYEQAYVDTALVMEPDVLELALHTLGTHRVLYGSDEPLSLIRAAHYHHPQLGPRLWSGSGYHWHDQAEAAEFAHLAPQAVLLHHFQIRCLLDTIDRVAVNGNRSAITKRIFVENACGVYGFDPDS
jgi:hypothetical protein